MTKEEQDMKVEVTLACGHTVQSTTYGTPEAREAMLAWFRRNERCKVCRVQHRDEELPEKLQAFLKKYRDPLPELWSPVEEWYRDLDMKYALQTRELFIADEAMDTLRNVNLIKSIVDEVAHAQDSWRTAKYLVPAQYFLDSGEVPFSLKAYAVDHRTCTTFWHRHLYTAQIELIYEWAFFMANPVA